LRPVLAGIATLEELETYYSIDDLADLHEGMDIQHEIEEYYSKKASAEMKNKRK